MGDQRERDDDAPHGLGHVLVDEFSGMAPSLADVRAIGRASVRCHDDLVEAAQKEAAERYQKKHGHNLSKAGQEEAASVAQDILQAPAGFTKFAGRMTRLYKEYGIEWPTVVLEYKNVNVTTKALVGSAGVPTLSNVVMQAAKDLFTKGGRTQDLHILQGVNGVLKPGRMTLLLGSPGSGKSTLQKLLSGRLKSKGLKVEGQVTYNGTEMSQFVVERTAAYVSQHDQHLPVLTVAETLEFAHACSGSRPDFISKDDVQQLYQMSRTGNFSKVQSAGDLAELTAGTCSSDDSESGRRVAEVVMGHDGFVHNPGEQDFTAEEFATLLRLYGSRFKVELVLRLLGLSNARDTIIGNNMVRGVSGGEKKRVTSGEMLVGNQRVLMMDEISTGLDSATLYSIITFLKQSVGALKMVALISLLQPPPEVMGLFDDVMLLSEGHVIYHGPVADVQNHFEDVGFHLPPRMDLPSWLVEITTPTGQWNYAHDELKLTWTQQPDSKRYLHTIISNRRLLAARAAASAKPSSSGTGLVQSVADKPVDPLVEPPVDPISGKLPMLCSSEAMAKKFWDCNAHGVAMLQEVHDGSKLPRSANPRSLVQQRYALNAPAALQLAIKRQWILFLRNKAFLIVRTAQLVFMGFVIGSLFYNSPPDRTGVRTLLGASFITLLFLAFGSAPELGLLMMNRPVWYRHRDNLFMPTYAETTSMALVRALNTAIESIIFTNIVYWMVGYTATAGAYFTYLLITLLTSLAMSGLFRLMGAVAATTVHAQAFGSLCILILILTSGFAIIRPSIPGWWIWAYYISPYSWALRAIAINEMTSKRWEALAPGNPMGLTLGQEGLDTFGLFSSRAWIWAGVGYLIGFFLLMNVLAYLALKYYSGQQERASVPDEQDVLKRRLKAEQRKQQLAAALTVLEPSNHISVSPALTKAQDKLHRAATGALKDVFTPITLVLRDVRYFVPNPAYKGSKKMARHSKSSDVASTADSGLKANQSLELGSAMAKERYTQEDRLSGGLGSNGTPSDSDALSGFVSYHDPEAPVVVFVQQNPLSEQDEEVPQELELLKGVSCYTEPGQLMCLMGGSGAGKTTLMDVIAGRKTVGRVTGDIMVNGAPKHQSSWARQVGYVEQNDIHSPATTVAEALWFSGRLRLPPSISDEEVRRRVDEVLLQVDLTERQGDLVGVAGSTGLTTEARKRLTIAVELVANPPVVFMDEPTSGLDARAAAIVMTAVKAVAAAGHTVMVTIHQPSIQIFEAFDTLLLLQRGGRVTYFGPLGEHSRALVEYMESVPGTAKLQAGYNPATWMLEVTGGAMATMTPANSGVDWPATYEASKLCKANTKKAQQLCQEGLAAAALQAGDAQQGALADRSISGYAQPFSRQLWECTWKLYMSYWRMPHYNLLRLLMTAACGLVYGTMYYKVGRVSNPASIGSVQNVMGVLFSGSNFLGNVNLMSCMPVFSTERVVFYRERAALMYTPLATGIATILAELPYCIVQASIFVPIVYWMVHFEHSAARFFYYYLMSCCSLTMFTAFGLLLVSATPMVELAQLLSGVLNSLFNIFNGFTIVESSIPAGWKWAHKIVPATWMIYGLGADQLGNNFTPLKGPGLPASTTVASYLESTFGYRYDFRWYALLIVACYAIGFSILAVMFMHKSFLKR